MGSIVCGAASLGCGVSVVIGGLDGGLTRLGSVCWESVTGSAGGGVVKDEVTGLGSVAVILGDFR